MTSRYISKIKRDYLWLQAPFAPGALFKEGTIHDRKIIFGVCKDGEMIRYLLLYPRKDASISISRNVFRA